MKLRCWWDNLWAAHMYRLWRKYAHEIADLKRETEHVRDYLLIESDRVQFMWQEQQRMKAQRDIAVRHLAGRLPDDIDAYLSTLEDG